MNTVTDIQAVQAAQVDRLGELLAQISKLTKEADAIKDEIKERGADGHLEIDDNGVAFAAGLLFRATYIEQESTLFDKAKFIKANGDAEYAKWTKQSASFKLLVKSL